MSITANEEETIMIGEINDSTPEEEIVRAEIKCECGITTEIVGLRKYFVQMNSFKGEKEDIGLILPCRGSGCTKRYIVKASGATKKFVRRQIAFPAMHY